MGLIDRQAAIDALDPLFESLAIEKINALPSAQPEITLKDVEEYCHKRCLIVITNELFHQMKAKWSQQEIIQCNDCKYVGTDATCCLVCKRDGMGLRPFHVYHDDFCSYAERRADAETEV